MVQISISAILVNGLDNIANRIKKEKTENLMSHEYDSGKFLSDYFAAA